ncbi:hypothetical protein GFC01_15345 [Desulfofundulus thermobenzoicus]|uniref:Metal-dependent hydrolase n=1 Tax=Desulfofundulus thermobenzoicus TaxID=29376 RepID=A0A6N7IVL2_9FIRM|nr:metal-dependent hydrolase [Desulfofundulus thermobenzoicus]MQL53613.1 hypothetical protein [Desulfofundulus thermobenzoicus]
MLWRTHFLAGAAAGLLMTGHHADIKTAAISAGVAGVMTLLAAFMLRFWFAHALAGYLSHLIMDSMNPQGVPCLWPFKKHISLPLVETGNLLEKVVVSPALLLLCGWFLFR